MIDRVLMTPTYYSMHLTYKLAEVMEVLSQRKTRFCGKEQYLLNLHALKAIIQVYGRKS